MSSHCERIGQSLPPCFQNAAKSKWVEVALFVSAAVLITLGLLVSFGILQLSSGTLFTNLMWAGGSFLIGLAAFKLLVQSNQYKEKSEQQPAVAPAVPNQMAIQPPAVQQPSPPLSAPPPPPAQQHPSVPPSIAPEERLRLGIPTKWQFGFLETMAEFCLFESEPVSEQELQQVESHLNMRLLRTPEPNDADDDWRAVFIPLREDLEKSSDFKNNPFGYLSKVKASEYVNRVEVKKPSKMIELLTDTLDELGHGIWNMRQKPPRAFR